MCISMMKNIILIPAFALMLLITNSCKTDFSINGPYERIPIVFGLLNSNDSIHIIKITRTYLGDEDNNQYAKIPDSNYFDVVDAKVIELDGNVETGREWTLHDTLITNKDSGLFYYPYQKVYVFYEPNLDETKSYKLVADLDEGDYQIESKTEMVSGFAYKSQYTQTGFTFGFAFGNTSQTGQYQNLRITFQEALNGKMYLTSLVFHWRETYTDNSTKDFSIRLEDNMPYYQDNPSQPINNGSVLGMETPSFNGEEFYQFIAENISPDQDVIKREFLGIDVVTAISNEVVATYMDISKPQTTIAETKPFFTNITSSSEKALGIFGCRQYVWVKGIALNANSLQELCIGKYTYDLNFCSTMIEHQNESFFCN